MARAGQAAGGPIAFLHARALRCLRPATLSPRGGINYSICPCRRAIFLIGRPTRPVSELRRWMSRPPSGRELCFLYLRRPVFDFAAWSLDFPERGVQHWLDPVPSPMRRGRGAAERERHLRLRPGNCRQHWTSPATNPAASWQLENNFPATLVRPRVTSRDLM